ncbi:MAG: Jag N-terminal domain-containing protein [Desulfobacterales bacterium]|nr:Jag N-terminal domain-containing protein [Desulfobacterales bacterium]
MMPCLEFEGKNIEKATKKASEKLNIPIDKLKYDVISYGSTGIFGLVGSKRAKISVTFPEESYIQKNDQKPKKNNQKNDSHESILNSVSSLIEATFNPSDDNTNDTNFPDDPLTLGKNILQNIINLITTDAEITAQADSDRILFHVKGGNSAVLIGKRGQTLEAIHYLVEKIINKHNEQRIRIQIDVEGYLEAKKANLQRLALRLSEKVKRSGKPVTIGQLNSHDRRIVHIALKDEHNVRTLSIGDGFYRKLVIFPKKNNYNYRKKGNPS